MSNKGVHGTIVGYILRICTHEIYMEKMNTFLRLVKTVLAPYLKTGHDSIYMLFLKNLFAYLGLCSIM